ncbi:2,3-bisphosphoglycerate-independent phosphoglycerate mutase [Desulfuribacillus alkaliarsenatis]|uniref:2,3-bisphosphoglycerate-independent phosphoglycerate mutase n=1 Tax=Desulfuribacillus alkaliarsenatis TaxID=766136 RepID=A0A1E5G446_9FIRM|nr:2,3-bisphosphoglycerate-independent phosphoglycerate mutase [Desulfuribacillus alkaliarsenatis]OEF97852.1 phosphoglycerate mutase (2,3-diphosphoglycerate-independent) [Desulfuribacillus alkaliarsenatis]
MTEAYKPVSLIILDGYGLREEETANAIKLAKTPVIDGLMQEYPTASLGASGEHVGLPAGQMGNSEVGHLNIGAGRIVYQELTRISKAIESGEFFTNPALQKVTEHVKSKHKKLHLLGLVSDGGVHSHSEHLYALLELAKKQGIADDVYVHAFLDGRDTAPDSGAQFIQELVDKMQEIGAGKLASIQGRYFAMDRDRRWDRVEKAYRALVYGDGNKTSEPVNAIKDSYANQVYDEFLGQTIIVDEKQEPVATINDGDGIIFFNFRPDRAIQLTRAFTEVDFRDFNRGEHPPQTLYVCMTEYSEIIKAEVAFKTLDLKNTLGEVLQDQQLTQLRIAETEKFKHVTSFFSGGREQEFVGETRILIDSPKVATYDLQPEMSAQEMTEVVCKQINEDRFDIIVLNFANPDMVGHTGNLQAAIQAVEAVDGCLGKVVEAIKQQGGVALITADHGNADMMQYPDGGRHTAHTANRVPFIITTKQHNGTSIELREDGILADLAPTILHLLNIKQPEEMTGRSIIR